MKWKDYDKEILTPYGKTGSIATEFNPNTIVFSYRALRHVAYHAYQAGIASQQADAADGEDRCNRPVQGFTVSHKPECKYYE